MYRKSQPLSYPKDKKSANICCKAALFCFLAAILIATQAGAAGVTAYVGGDGDDHDLTLGYETEPFWQGELFSHALYLNLEYSLGWVHTSSEPSNQDLWHTGITPYARWWLTPHTGLELGIGANLFSGTRIGGKNINTAFQFGDSLGVIHHPRESRWLFGLRFIHYSNADIKRPNPGMNFLQLRAGYEL